MLALLAVSGLLAQLVPYVPPVLFGSAAALLLLALALNVSRRAWGWCALPLVCIAGACNTWLGATEVLQHRFSLDTHPREQQVRGWVSSLPTHSTSEWGEFTHFNMQVDDNLRELRLSWNEAPQLHPGQCWVLQVRLGEVRGQLNPGGFDLARWAAQKDIDALGQVLTPVERCRDRAAPVDTARHQLVKKLLNRHQNGGEMAALALGYGGGITQQQWDLFRATGTLHLAVISGMHIILMATAAWLVLSLLLYLPGLNRLLLYRPRAYWVQYPTMLFALGYALLAGMDTPVQRALLMVLVLFGDRLTPVPLSALDRWLIALGIIVWFDPMAPLGAGFWLSFLGVAILLFMQRRYRNNPIPWWKWPVRALHLQLVLSTLMAPALALSVGQIPLMAPVANLLMGPIFSLVLIPVSLLLTLGISWLELGALDPILASLFSLTYAILQGLAYDELLIHGGFNLALLIGACALVLLPRWGWLALPLTMLILLWGQQTQSGVRVTVLDVGQGLSVLVQHHNYNLLYDTGTLGATERAVLPALRALGVKRLNTLLISHTDVDHAGGYWLLRRKLRPERVLVGGARSIADTYQPCRAGLSWRHRQLEFSALWPDSGITDSSNASACVLRLQHPGGTLIILGDIGKTQEYQLMRREGQQLHSDILIAPHHGSQTSSGAGWLRMVNPTLAVFSAGYPSRYGHPHPEVQARYQALGIRTWITGRDGAISFWLEQDAPIRVSAQRQQQHFWWSWR